MSNENLKPYQPDLFTDPALVIIEQPIAAQADLKHPSIAERTNFDPNGGGLKRYEKSGAGGGFTAAVSGELTTNSQQEARTLTAEKVVSRAAKVARTIVELPRPGYDNSPEVARSLSNEEAKTLKEQSQPHIAEARAMLGLQSGGLGPRVGR